ncbi:MAG: hypothetical protein IIU19_01970 [Oscillospiraceae bacterium]|nr:hypothetical protein [Oscillospiraceae bacterium]
MTDREVRQLTRAQLISLLAEVTGENEELKAEIGRLNEEVGKLTVTNEKLERLEKISLNILYRICYPNGRKGGKTDPAASGKEDSPSSEDKTEGSADREHTDGRE